VAERRAAPQCTVTAFFAHHGHLHPSAFMKSVILSGVKKLVFSCVQLIAALSVGSRSLIAAGQDFTGHWESASPLKIGVLGLSVDLAKGDSGEWVGSLSDPVRKVYGIRVKGIAIQADKIKFLSPDLPGTPTYDLMIRKDALQGTVSVQGNALPLMMKRAGKADVKITPASPAVSKELEGDWEGALPGGGQTVTFHLKNRQDQTVDATMSGPGLPGKAQAFARVIQTGAEVELTLFIFGGSYRGTINGDGTEMTGAWTQNPGAPPFPLNMRKR
jgi:hypothetical protein